MLWVSHFSRIDISEGRRRRAEVGTLSLQTHHCYLVLGLGDHRLQGETRNLTVFFRQCLDGLLEEISCSAVVSAFFMMKSSSCIGK